MTKKTLAREILIFVSGLAIVFLAFVTLWTINSNRQSRNEEIRTRKIQLSDSITSISERIESVDTLLRLERLYLFCRANNLDVPDYYDSFERTLINSDIDRRKYFEYLKTTNIELPRSVMENDFGFIPDERTNDSHFDFTKANAFEIFTNHFFDSLDREKIRKEKIKEPIGVQIKNVNAMKDEITRLTGNISETLNLKDYLITFLIIIAIIIYPIRILVQLTIWSIKTLKAKNEQNEK